MKKPGWMLAILLLSMSPQSLGQAAPTATPGAKPAAVAAKPEPQAAAPARRAGTRTMDRLELDPTAITGNRELPKVMVIVPWKPSEIGDLQGLPANSLLNEVLAPVDREVFQREVRYHHALEEDRVASPPVAAGTQSTAAPQPET